AVRRRERAEEQLRAELVEAMAELVVRGREDEEPPTLANHAHAIGERDGKVEHVLERASIDERVAALLQARRDRLGGIVGDNVALVIGMVHGGDPFGAEEMREKTLGVVAERERHGFAREPVPSRDLRERAAVGVEVLSPEGDDAAERDALRARLGEENGRLAI